MGLKNRVPKLASIMIIMSPETFALRTADQLVSAASALVPKKTALDQDIQRAWPTPKKNPLVNE